MATTERVLGGVIVTGIAACLGLIVWPAGPDSASAHAPALVPVETPGLPPAVASAPEVLDPLTESVVGSFSAPGAARRVSLAGNTGANVLTTTFSREPGGEAIADDLNQVLLSRLKVVGSESTLVADFDGDAELSDSDTDQFQQLWEEGDPKADLNSDGEIDATDFAAFIDAYNGQSRTPGVENLIRLHFVNDGRLESGGGNGRFEVQLGVKLELSEVVVELQ